MTTNEKKEKINQLVSEMLTESHEAMLKKVETLFNSGAIDIDSWSIDNAPMVLPKCIVSALLDSEIYQYSGIGTTHEKANKKTIRNLRYFI